MAQEIERKFLVKGEFKTLACRTVHLVQGYLSSVPDRTVRIRVSNDQGFITIKGKSSTDGLSRYEWEKEIPVDEAWELLTLCESGIIDKTRYFIPAGNHLFEVDEFHGENEGLVLAEVELASVQEEITIPDWLGEEVTGNPRYYNATLSRHPYRTK